MHSLRIFHVTSEQFAELAELPEQRPSQGFIWIGVVRSALESRLGQVQAALQRWAGAQVVDLHVSDLLNESLPSHYDDTSWYDLLVFRRLATVPGSAAALPVDNGGGAPIKSNKRGSDRARQLFDAIDTSAVGFAVFDHVLLTVHPNDCAVREYFAQRLAALNAGADLRGNSRLPTSPADLMLRMVNHMVDSYLDLRRLLTRELGQLQAELLDPRSRFEDWSVVLDSRNALHLLEDTCEDQRSAVQEWIDTLDEWPPEAHAEAQRERELLRVRSRDVLEHVERVLSHVRRLEQSAETAVQMHFSALGHRTNEIMRTLTVLTAIFLPLNLITGFFGMNFDSLPLIHSGMGFWVAFGLMAAVALVLVMIFRRKRYLGTSRR
jgi:magnesium transporter